MNDDKNQIEFNKKQQGSLQKDLSSIRFKRKKTKSNMRIGGKLIAYFIIAGLSGALFSNIMMNIKYGDIIYQAKIVERNQNMTINNYSNVINTISPSIVTVACKEENLLSNTYFEGNSTGIVLDEKGNILTNYSNAKDSSQIFVKIPAKGTMPVEAKFIVGDEEMDIAIIRIDSSNKIQPVKIANTDAIEEGQEIAILSNSIGDSYIGSIVPGMITSREVANPFEEDKHSLMSVSAPINKENNGGAVCNSKGELIGIASEKISKLKNLEGSYYVLKANELANIISLTKLLRNLLGIDGGGILPKGKNDLNGFYVENVVKDRSAYNAGIRPTDIIIKINEKDIKDSNDIYEVLENKKTGDILRCQIKRNDQIQEVELVL